MNSDAMSLSFRGVALLQPPLPQSASPEVSLRALTTAVRRGDEAAFVQFHDLYNLRLYKYLLVLAKGDETEAREITLRQPARIDTRNGGIVNGSVLRIDPVVQNGTVTVEVSLDGDLPAGLRPDMSVDGTIEIDRKPDALFVGRPIDGSSSGASSVFLVEPNHKFAHRIPVRFGAGSVSSIEILDGLKVGDEIILSDMSSWDGHDRIRIR